VATRFLEYPANLPVDHLKKRILADAQLASMFDLCSDNILPPRSLEIIMKPYMFVIWIKPTKKSEDNGTGRAEVIYGPDVLIAQDDKQAQMLAAREIPEDFVKDINRVEVSVRPF